jgi:hypothetical protein
MNIKIVEGGERLYVNPYSYKHTIGRQRIFYLESQERYPYPNDAIIGLMKQPLLWNMTPLQRMWYAGVKRLFVGMGRWLRFNFQMSRNPVDWYYTTLEHFILQAVPFNAQSYPGIRFSLPHQLAIIDKDRLVDDVYVTPSDNWLQKEVDLWVAGPHPDSLGEDGEDYLADEREAYKRWSAIEIAKGHKIGFIVSLDT